MDDSLITHESVWERPGAGRTGISKIQLDDSGTSLSFDWMTPPSQWDYIPYVMPKPRGQWNRKNKGEA